MQKGPASDRRSCCHSENIRSCKRCACPQWGQLERLRTQGKSLASNECLSTSTSRGTRAVEGAAVAAERQIMQALFLPLQSDASGNEEGLRTRGKSLASSKCCPPAMSSGTSPGASDREARGWYCSSDARSCQHDACPQHSAALACKPLGISRRTACTDCSSSRTAALHAAGDSGPPPNCCWALWKKGDVPAAVARLHLQRRQEETSDIRQVMPEISQDMLD